MIRKLSHALAAAALLTVTITPGAHAQGFLHKLKDKASQKINDRIDQRTDEALDSLINSSENVIDCAVADQNCITKVHAAGKQVRYVDANGNPVANQPDLQGGNAGDSTGSADAAPPGAGAWLNYDFVPGDKVLFYDDFADDHVGDLPSHEDVADGNVTIVDIKGKHYFRTVSGAQVWINLPDTLPDRFTIEATYFADNNNGNPLTFYIGDGTDHPMDVWCYHDQAGVEGAGRNGDKNSHDDATGGSPTAFVHCRFMFDKGYVKAYLDAQRLGQLNGLVFTRTDKIRVRVPSGSDDEPTLVTDIRIAEGGKPLYDALLASGRVSTHGILFASGSDKIRGESTPTLKEIGDMLTQHPDLKLLIEGHTDNVGDSASNQALSKRRAASVKQYLITQFKVAPARLSTKGYGDTKPIDTNATAEGRQNNRRVELVKE